MQASENRLCAIALLIGPTLLAHATCVRYWLESSSHAWLEMLAMLANLDNDASTFVSSTASAVVAHLSKTLASCQWG
jgi:hypothetical protein